MKSNFIKTPQRLGKHSLAVIIPAKILVEMGIEKNSLVSVRYIEKSGKKQIIIEKIENFFEGENNKCINK